MDLEDDDGIDSDNLLEMKLRLWEKADMGRDEGSPGLDRYSC